MIGSIPAIHALGAGPLRLVAPGALSAPVAFARASSGLSTAADGTAWQASAADAPRFAGAARRLLVEGARTNLVRNPGAAGAVAGVVGSGGVVPTGWGIGSGVSREVTPGTMNGIPGVFLRYFGVPGSTGAQTVVPLAETTGTVGDTCTISVFAAWVAGSVPANMSAIIFRNTGETPSIPAPLTATLQRLVQTKALPTTTIQPTLRWNYTDTASPVDFTLFVGGFQAEMAAFASSPVLPPAGTVAVSTRAADAINMPLTAAQATRGTLVGTFTVPQAAPAGSAQVLLALDDGTDGNRLYVENAAGSTTIQAGRRTAGGAYASTASAGTFTAGVPFKAALAWGQDGSAALVVRGAPPVFLTAVPSGAVNALRIGQYRAGLPMFGEVGPLDLYPSRLPDSGLQALTAPV